MLNASQIADKVLDIVQGPSFDISTVLAELNAFAAHITSRVLFPALEAEANVVTVTTAASVNLPDNFQRNLFHCRNATGQPVTVLTSKAQLARRCGNDLAQTGTRTIGVAPAAPLLWYAPIPAVAETLTLSYHRKPDVITSASTLSFLPDGFDDLAINWVCWKLYARIEQGTEGNKTDTSYYSNLYLGMLEELRLSIPQGVSMPSPPVSIPERW